MQNSVDSFTLNVEHYLLDCIGEEDIVPCSVEVGRDTG